MKLYDSNGPLHKRTLLMDWLIFLLGWRNGTLFCIDKGSSRLWKHFCRTLKVKSTESQEKSMKVMKWCDWKWRKGIQSWVICGWTKNDCYWSCDPQCWTFQFKNHSSAISIMCIAMWTLFDFHIALFSFNMFYILKK